MKLFCVSFMPKFMIHENSEVGVDDRQCIIPKSSLPVFAVEKSGMRGTKGLSNISDI